VERVSEVVKARVVVVIEKPRQTKKKTENLLFGNNFIIQRYKNGIRSGGLKETYH
jgi:hypothetical protein